MIKGKELGFWKMIKGTEEDPPPKTKSARERYLDSLAQNTPIPDTPPTPRSEEPAEPSTAGRAQTSRQKGLLKSVSIEHLLGDYRHHRNRRRNDDENVGSTYLSNNQSGSSTEPDRHSYGGNEQTIEIDDCGQVNQIKPERESSQNINCNGQATFDLRAGQNKTIPAGQLALVDTNLRVVLPKETFLKIMPKVGPKIANIGQIIDGQPNSTIKVIIHNQTDQTFKIKKKQRIAEATLFEDIPILTHLDRPPDQPEDNLNTLVATMDMAMATYGCH